LNFGSDFLKTCELWSTCFATFGKRLETTTRNPNNFGQSLKNKESYKSQMLTMISIFSNISKIWFTYFYFYGKPLSRVTRQQISLHQISKAKTVTG